VTYKLGLNVQALSIKHNTAWPDSSSTAGLL